MKTVPLSLYLHIPWCIRKCPYCDFNSHAADLHLDEGGYVDALLADLEYDLLYTGDREVETIFIGGGTPSLFSPESITRLLVGVGERIRVARDAEVTLEANPGTLETGRFAGYRAAGVNRLSIGVQSFNKWALEKLGRIHGPEEALAAVDSARSAGFDNFNIDLMFGLPGQTLEQARADVEMAIGLNPTHISYYQLTLEPNTLFYSQPPVLPEEGLLWEIQSAGQSLLEQAGYKQYEVSAYSQPGKQCRHNLNYWQFGDYLGIGAGAHGKITDAVTGEISRRWRLRGPREYMAAAGSQEGVSGSSKLEKDDLVIEFLMNALRLHDGFAQDLFIHRTGLDLDRLLSRLKEPLARGLITADGKNICPTPLGRQFLDDLLALTLY